MLIRNNTILLVDDEISERKRMRAILNKVGYTVIESRDYSEANAIFLRRRDEIDLLLIDVSLPGNNGCELANTSLALNPSVKVLFMSGHAGAEVCRFYGIAATDVHFLEKPFQETDLLTRIQYLLDSGEPLAGSVGSGGGLG